MGAPKKPRVSSIRRLILAVAVFGAVLGVGGPASAAAPSPAAAEDQFYASLNAERSGARLAPLTADPTLDTIATEWSTQMANENHLYHRPDYRVQVEARVTTAWTRIGENVGKGSSVPSLHAAFMASAGHRANILGDYNRVGVGVVVRGDVIWVTVNFLKGPVLAVASPVTTLRGIDQACPARMPQSAFTDVSLADVHGRAINCMAWWDVAGGVTTSSFAPAGRVTRAQMASFVAREIQASGYVLPAHPANAFGDDSGSVHELRVNQLAAVGVVGGVSPGTFRPNDAVTRGQMATFLVRAHDLVSADDLPNMGSRFSDDGGSVHEASIDKSAAAGLAGGTSAAIFSPLEPVTRAQLTSFLARNLDLLVSDGEATTP